MSYLRLDLNFFDMRSTMELEELIGEKAFWVPVRLKAYALRCQPDGDFSGFSGDLRRKVLGIANPIHAKQTWDALHKVGFLAGDKIANFADEVTEHQKRHNAATKAARARWSKAEPPTDPPESEKAPPGAHNNPDLTSRDTKGQTGSASNEITPFPSPVKGDNPRLDMGEIPQRGVAPAAGEGVLSAREAQKPAGAGQGGFLVPVFEPIRPGMFPSTAAKQRNALEEDLEALRANPAIWENALSKFGRGQLADLEHQLSRANATGRAKIEREIAQLKNPAAMPAAYVRVMKPEAKSASDALRERIKALRQVEKGMVPK